MRCPSSPSSTCGRLALALALVALATAAAPARATEPTRADRIAPTPSDFAGTRLRRAAAEQFAGNPAGVVENLEPLDWANEALFDDMDRAAFLLARAYLDLGGHDRFATLAHTVAGWSRTSIYTDWIAYHADTASPDSAAFRRDAGTGGRGPLEVYLEALNAAANGESDEVLLMELSSMDTVSVLGRDLAGVALIRRATRAMESGGDPEALLERVPAASRYEARAHHMLGMLWIERGEADRGRALLESITAGDSCYTGHDEVTLSLAGLAIDEGRWEGAYRIYSDLDRSWTAHQASLEAMLASGIYDTLWRAWESPAHESEALLIDGGSSNRLSRMLADEAADLGAKPATEVPAGDATQGGALLRWQVPPPSEAEWRATATAERAAESARYDQAENRRARETEERRLASLRGYLDQGLERAARERAILSGQATLLDSLRATLDLLDGRLAGVRDSATHRVLLRTTRTLREGADNLLWIAAMRRFHVDGPNAARARYAPPGMPSADSLLTREEALARSLRVVVAAFAEDWPELIARSHAEAWRPGLIDRVHVQGAETARQLAWLDTLETDMTLQLERAGTSPVLLALERREPALRRRADSLEVAHRRIRDEAARGALRRALARMDVEREGIDYGLAAASYGLSVGLGREADSLVAGADSLAPFSGAEMDDPRAIAWRGTAIASLDAFLDRHPESFARGEMRFRLADLLLIEARHEFQEQMAAYVEDQKSGGGNVRLPVLSHEPALELYKAILAEDTSFEHTDAVLFNAGMILADEGNTEAAAYFGRLVSEHPESDYRQESWLRMGDLAFNAKRFDESIDSYGHAAEGPDPSLMAIALYKKGWAHFNQDQFMDATDAFRAVLDLYAESGDRIEADIAGESESYMVHALARAGGAPAFEGYFDRIGERQYEHRVLMALGQHYRRFSLFDEAARADELSLSRFPHHPDALVSAKRLVETHERAEQHLRAREARLAWAPRFVPSSEWARAQASDSVRTAGSEFSRRAWEFVANHHHREARTNDSATDWREALRLYRTLLSHWPEDGKAPTFNLYAGEASMRLDAYPDAIEHYNAAAAAGSDSIAELAMHQRVAVSDTWYESTRGRGGTELGSDSLAHVVLGFADELLGRFPDHEGADDIVWRQGNIAFAHGWHERAAGDFGRMVDRYPGDARVPRAAGLQADALFRIERFDEAGTAYERTVVLAGAAGMDSLASKAREAVPISHYRHAEQVAANEPRNHERQAELFEKVATGWPDYEHAHVAQYRAALARLEAGQPRRGIEDMQKLIADFPQSEYVQDAHLHIAKTWEAEKEYASAGEAYAVFAKRYSDDASAPDAWLKAADLYEQAGLQERAEAQRVAYIRQYPDDRATAMEILDVLARREIAAVTPGSSISGVLARPSASADTTGTGSYLSDYVRRAEANPELASNDLRAQVLFLRGEEVRTGYMHLRLTQPLPASIALKQALLDSMLTLYRASIDFGAEQWAHASAFRIGHVLVAFGEALEQSERPGHLAGEDLLAYEDVLLDESQPFYDRGEAVWEDLLRQKGVERTDDPWLTLARESLWKRLAYRFYFRPEVEYPLVAGKAPSGKQPVDIERQIAKGKGGKETTPVAQQEEDSK